MFRKFRFKKLQPLRPRQGPRFARSSEIRVLPGKSLYSKLNSPGLRGPNGAQWHHQVLFRGL